MKKKILSLLLTGVLAVSMMLPASATNITISGSGAGSEYSAYRLLNLTISLKDENCHTGENAKHSDDCYNYSYTVNPKYREALVDATHLNTNLSENEQDKEIVKAISEMSSNSDEIRTFADTVFASVKNMSVDAGPVSSEFTNVAQGYYLITESKVGADPDAVSLVMLDTAGDNDVEVTTKEGLPTITKKIKDGDKLVDAIDVNKGDTVTFVLTCTVHPNLDEYDHFICCIHDTAAEGIEIDPDSVRVMLGDIDVTPGFSISTDTEDGCSLEIETWSSRAENGEWGYGAQFPTVPIWSNDVFTVSYNATLGESYTTAKTGNTNAACIEFQNDPYNTASTSRTLLDKVAVFTYEVVVNKTDNEGKALPGASFQIIPMLDGAYDKNNALTPTLSNNGTTFTFSGLDSGKYKLVETAAPDGYTKADDVEFEIVATYPEESDAPELTALVIKDGDTILSDGDEAAFSVSVDDGSISTSVINITGHRMPITGGMGTYLFYGGGIAILIIGIGTLVVLRKRNSNTETVDDSTEE